MTSAQASGLIEDAELAQRRKLARERAREVRSRMRGSNPSGQAGRRGLGAPLRRSFLEVKDGTSTLGALMSSNRGVAGGGRGGRTRLMTYMSLLWVLAGDDFTTRRPASYWAELMGLADPVHNGARAVRDSLRELERRKLVVLEPPAQSGQAPRTRLLNESGGDYPYIPPSGGREDPYIRVPEALWTAGTLTKLTGPGLAMLLIVISVSRADQPDRRLRFPPTNFRQRFGLGESTRKAGLANLVEHEILWSRQEAVDHDGERVGRTFLRNVYQLDDQYAPKPPATTGSASKSNPVLTHTKPDGATSLVQPFGDPF